MERARLAVVISGQGSNLQALLDAGANPAWPARVTAVISNRPDAPGLDRATAAGVPARVLDHRAFASRDAFDGALAAALESTGADFVCLAGFMRVLGAAFVAAFAGRLVNIHPSLLPAFRGLAPQRQALAAGVRISGCTVHFVTPEVDAGAIIAQAAVPVHAGDSEDSLAARIRAAEHRLHPMAVAALARGDVAYADGRAVIRKDPGLALLTQSA